LASALIGIAGKAYNDVDKRRTPFMIPISYETHYIRKDLTFLCHRIKEKATKENIRENEHGNVVPDEATIHPCLMRVY
jgi:hypothetical protein